MLRYVVPVIIGLVWVAVFSLLREPYRQQVSALMLAGAGAAYIGSGAFEGAWGFLELGFTMVIVVVAYLGLRRYQWLGVGWLLHTAWDVVHHAEDAPIIPHLPGSSFGCAICDPVIAGWYLLGAPSLWSGLRRLRGSQDRPDRETDREPAPRLTGAEAGGGTDAERTR